MTYMKDITVAIIGTSLFSKAIAAEFAQHGATVGLVVEGCERPMVEVIVEEQDRRQSHKFLCTSDWSWIQEATCVVTSLIGEELLSACRRMAPYMHDGQMLAVFPGYFMVEPITQIFRDAGKPSVLVCELTSSPVVCDAQGDGTIHIHKRKNKLKIAGIDADAGQRALNCLKDYLPMLALAKNAVETSLENINTILHPLPLLMNLATVERAPQRFRHFIDGIDQNISRLMHLMDEERLAVGAALGLTLDPVLSHLKSYYGDNDARTIYEYIHTPECPYDDIRGFGLASRYITLDVPGLIVPTAKLARSLNIPTPLHDACIALASPFL